MYDSAKYSARLRCWANTRTTWRPLRPERARTLLDDHLRVREASRGSGDTAVHAVPRPDVIGVYVPTPQDRLTMARTGHTQVQIAFEALSIEGGLLGADWLAKVAQLLADRQTPADYSIPDGLADPRRDRKELAHRPSQLWRYGKPGRASGGDTRALAQPLRRDTSARRASFHVRWPGEGNTRKTRVRRASTQCSSPPLADTFLSLSPPLGAGLDTPLPEFGNEGRRRTAFGLVQEALNASPDALWGLATDGWNAARRPPTTQALPDPLGSRADLGRMFTEELYSDFAALWLLAHETRFGRPADPPTSCPLEEWRGVRSTGRHASP